MRYLGIDYGAKRIGIAVSDDNGRMAFPIGVIMNRGMIALKEIIGTVKKEHIGIVVVGVPVGLNGKETQQTKKIRLFVTVLTKKIQVPVEIENEMFTSRMAVDSGMKDSHIDASSAALILQSYLDKKSKL